MAQKTLGIVTAYGEWLDAGNVGTKADFLASLKGMNGLSAYETALNNGFVGSEADWLEFLKGEKGDAGNTIGVPDGGQTGEVLRKVSPTDFDTEWASPYPSSGIPKGNLASDVQSSLDKADNAVLQGVVGKPGGVAELDDHGVILFNQLPSANQSTEEAPINGNSYIRKDKGWVILPEETDPVYLEDKPTIATKTFVGTELGAHDISPVSHNSIRQAIANEAISRGEAIEAHNEAMDAHPDIRDTINGLTGLPEFDDDTEVLTFTTQDGHTLEVNLPLKALAKDLDYDEDTKELVITKQDDTEIRVDVADLIDVYTASLIATHIQITIHNNEIEATLINGSIGEDKLSTTLSAKINGKQDKIPAGTVGNLVTYSGVTGMVESLDPTELSMLGILQVDNTNPTATNFLQTLVGLMQGELDILHAYFTAGAFTDFTEFPSGWSTPTPPPFFAEIRRVRERGSIIIYQTYSSNMFTRSINFNTPAWNGGWSLLATQDWANGLFTGKQDKIAAGTAGNLVTYSGTAGSLSSIPQNTFNPRIAVTLPDETDLNTITTSGYYKGYGDVSAQTMLNMPAVPSPVSFLLIVLGFIDSNQNNVQLLRFGNTPFFWMRTSSSGGQWSDWRHLVPREHREILANNTDLDDIQTQGSYQVVSSGNANTIVHRPLTSSPTGFILEVEAQSNSDGVAQTVKYFNNQNLIYYRSAAMNSIGWQPWILLGVGSAGFAAPDVQSAQILVNNLSIQGNTSTSIPVIPSNGFLSIMLNVDTSLGDSLYCTVTLNGISILDILLLQSTTNSQSLPLIPVKQGDVVTANIHGIMSSGSSITSAWSIPWTVKLYGIR